MRETFSSTSRHRPTSIHRQLSKKIQILRFMRGWSQETLAELADVHRNYIGHVERLQVNAGLAHLEKIAKAFDIPIHELLDMQTTLSLKT